MIGLALAAWLLWDGVMPPLNLLPLLPDRHECLHAEEQNLRYRCLLDTRQKLYQWDGTMHALMGRALLLDHLWGCLRMAQDSWYREAYRREKLAEVYYALSWDKPGAELRMPLPVPMER
jgi:hypothetical protein